MKYTQMPSDTFQKLQMNAGILVDSFNPDTGEIGNILGATTGGIQFAMNPSFLDFGEDIDNCPNNTKELKMITAYDPQMSGTFLTVTTAQAKRLIGAADIDNTDNRKVVPRAQLKSADFADLWWIGDYTDINTGDNAGFIAIHLINALNTSGFQIQSQKQNKGQFSFEFHGHYSIDAIDTVPFEIYVKTGSTTTNPEIDLDLHSATVEIDDTLELHARVIPTGTTVTWSSSDSTKASVSNGTVTGKVAGSAIITASITVDGVTYTDTCTIIVPAAAST